MKKIFKFLLIFTLSIYTLTGCSLKQYLEMNITEDENVSMSIIIAMDNEMIDNMINSDNIILDGENNIDSKKQEISDEQRWEYINESSNDFSDKFKKEKYDIDNFKGYKYTINLGKLSDISIEKAEDKIDLSKIFNGEELQSRSLFIKNGVVYKSNIKYSNSEKNNYSNYEKYGASFNINFVINLPQKSISNNADNIENNGKKLSWDLKQ